MVVLVFNPLLHVLGGRLVREHVVNMADRIIVVAAGNRSNRISTHDERSRGPKRAHPAMSIRLPSIIRKNPFRLPFSPFADRYRKACEALMRANSAR